MIGIVERMGFVNRVWLNFEIDRDCNWEGFLSLLLEMQVPVITMTVHSTALFRGLTPYTRDMDDERKIFARIEKVFKMIGQFSELEPATVSEAAKSLERRYKSTLCK